MDVFKNFTAYPCKQSFMVPDQQDSTRQDRLQFLVLVKFPIGIFPLSTIPVPDA